MEAERIAPLPGGLSLYRKPNGVGGYTYTSDEIGGGVMVWDTALVSPTTLLIALAEEARRVDVENRARKSDTVSNRNPPLYPDEGISGGIVSPFGSEPSRMGL